MVRVLGIVVILIVAIAIVLPFLIDANQFRPALESRLSTALGREVKLGDLRVALLQGAVTAGDLSIADDPAFSKTPFLRAQSFKVGVEMRPLIFSREIHVTGISIGEPQIDLVQNRAGVWNFSSIGGKTGGASGKAEPAGQTSDVSVASLNISDGRVTMTKAGSKPLVVDKLNIDAKNLSATSAFPFTMTAALAGGGSLKLEGTAGPVSTGDAATTPFQAKINVSHLDMLASGIIDPSSGMAGIASIDGTAQSARGVISLTGKLKGEELRLAKGGTPAKRPLDVDLAISHNVMKQEGEVRQMAMHLGGATATLTGTYNLETSPATVNLKLAGSQMPLTELAAFLPALDITLPKGATIDQGTANVNLASEGRLDALVTQGTLGAENARLANFDFASKMQVLQGLAGLKPEPYTTIQTLSANVRNSPAGTTVDNLLCAVPSIGNLTGAGTITASKALDFKMKATLASTAVSSRTGLESIPFLVQGTADNPAVKPDVKGLATETLKGITEGKGPAAGFLDGLLGGKKKTK
jgi:AsmA protein